MTNKSQKSKVKSQKFPYSHTLIRSFFSSGMNVCLYGWMVMLSLTSLLVFSACNNEKIPEDTLVKVYTDIVIAQDTTSGPSANHTTIKNSVFKRYNISAEEYEASIKRMESNPELWESFFNKTIEHVEKLRAKEKDRKN